MKRLLVVEAGSGAANNLIRSLGAAPRQFNIIGINNDRFVLKRSTAARNFLTPAPDRRDFTRALRRLVEAERVDLVLPVTEPHVNMFSGFGWLRPRLFLPKRSTIELCRDKYKLSMFLAARGIPVPATYPVRDPRRIGALLRHFRNSRAWCRIRRGWGAIGAVPVRTADEARHWIESWRAMRGVQPRAFTLSEYLPGRDLGCQSIWRDGDLVLIKTYERLSYFGTGTQPGTVSSVATLAKTVRHEGVTEICADAVRALDARASGAFSIDLRENENGVPCITDINAGRLSSGTNLLDLTGKHNMAVTYARIALDLPVDIRETYDVEEECYMLRDLDTLPAVHRADEFFEEIGEIVSHRGLRTKNHWPTREAPPWVGRTLRRRGKSTEQ